MEQPLLPRHGEDPRRGAQPPDGSGDDGGRDERSCRINKCIQLIDEANKE